MTELVVVSTRPRDRGLRPVLHAIPPHCYHRPVWKGAVHIVRSVALYAGALVLLAVAHRWWLVAPLEVVASLSVAGLFILAHDAAHGALFASRRANRVVGRLLMVPALHIYESWVLGHNRVHHRHTLRRGLDFVWHPLTRAEYHALGRFGRARHRLEWSRFGAGLYYGREVWWKRMMTFTPAGRHRDAIRRDRRFVVLVGGGALALLAAGGWAVGGAAAAVWLPVKLAVVPWLGFLCVIGWTVHVHHIAPDIAWWDGREWSAFRGQVEGTTIYRVPRLLNVFLLNIFVHLPHHVDARIPFYALPDAARAIAAEQPELVRQRPLRWRTYVDNVRACKLYDFDGHRWLTYGEAAGV